MASSEYTATWAGEIPMSRTQPPTSSELTIDTSTRSVTEATDEIERMLAGSGILFDELVDLAANI